MKSHFSRNWSLRNRGQAFCIFKHVFFSLLVITMAFGKKDKIFKTRLGTSIVSGISLLLGALHTLVHLFFIWFINWWAVLFIEAGAWLISKLFYSNQ
ncbi:hypothetical protein [Helicobacter pylori]|uniref:hypothetical protein n=1 Tax=Helicobacter pylori TaxID=210 RepID=UPI001BB3879A|nr:hypothetical protein [Helicobacter pylori]